MNRVALAFLILAFAAAVPASAEDSDDKTISGTVASVDWVKSVVIVRCSIPYTGNTDELSLRVTSDSELSRGSESISLGDIEQSDPVTVTYYRDDLSGLKIRHLSDLNDANE